MPSLLDAFKDDSYRIGDAQAILYDRTRTAIFPPGYIGQLYWKMQGSMYSNRDGDGMLRMAFPGFSDFSWDAITLFLLQRPLVVMGIWNGDKFEAAGIGYPVISVGHGETEKMCFAGYLMFREWWGSVEAEGLAMLGLCLMFKEWNLSAIHGTRFPANHLTARFMRKFGFRDIGTIDKYMLCNGKLVPAVVSTLLREDFEQYLEQAVGEAYDIGR
jgi:RimJ/RimL family protein N-acetyltransferase